MLTFAAVIWCLIEEEWLLNLAVKVVEQDSKHKLDCFLNMDEMQHCLLNYHNIGESSQILFQMLLKNFSKQNSTVIPLHSYTKAKQQVPNSQNVFGSLMTYTAPTILHETK